MGFLSMRLPAPPSLDEIQAHTPRIAPLAEAVERPFWSVMIPTYNNDEYLRRTLASVLSQDLGPERMQIEVVDGCSTRGDSAAVVEQLGRPRCVPPAAGQPGAVAYVQHLH